MYDLTAGKGWVEHMKAFARARVCVCVRLCVQSSDDLNESGWVNFIYVVRYLKARICPEALWIISDRAFYFFFKQLDMKRSQLGDRALAAAAGANTNTYGHLQRIIYHTVQVSDYHNDRSFCSLAAFLQMFFKTWKKNRRNVNYVYATKQWLQGDITCRVILFFCISVRLFRF